MLWRCQDILLQFRVVLTDSCVLLRVAEGLGRLGRVIERTSLFDDLGWVASLTGKV